MTYTWSDEFGTHEQEITYRVTYAPHHDDDILYDDEKEEELETYEDADFYADALVKEGCWDNIKITRFVNGSWDDEWQVK